MNLGWRWAIISLIVAAAPLAAQTPPADADSAPRAIGPLAPNRTLNEAETLLAEHHWKSAHDRILPWLLSHPHAPDHDRGLYLLAQAYYQGGDRIRAFYHLDELMDNFPESKLFFPALELQYKIADAYLNGYKEKFLGLRIIGEYEEAIEMLYRIQERSPGSPIAERALKRTADYYFSNSDFDLAGDAYGVFVRTYPRSLLVPQVRLRQAFSSLAQFRGPRFDATPLIDARTQFKEILLRYPQLAADANVSNWIDRIDADLARKAYVKGDYYRRTNQPRGAVFMYRYVIQTYPNSQEAGAARHDLAKMPRYLMSDAPPPPSSADEAAVNPSPRPAANERPR